MDRNLTRKRKRSFDKMFAKVKSLMSDNKPETEEHRIFHQRLTTDQEDTPVCTVPMFVRTLNDCKSTFSENDETPCTSHKQTGNTFNANEFVSEDVSDDQLSSDQEEGRASFQEALKHWAIESNISRKHLTSLLHLHNSFLPQLNLPKTADCLLSKDTPSEYVVSNTFSYVGIQKSSEHFLPYLKSQSFTLLVNFDGISFFKSSVSQCWPILGCFQELREFPFLIGIFYGKGKPTLSEYLDMFVDDMNNIINHGLNFHGKTWTFEGVKFITDAPARSLVKGIKYPSGYSCCDKCNIEGEYSLDAKCVIFPGTMYTKRTDSDFRNQTDECHHRIASPLTKISGIDMIESFVIDSMHCVYLGIMKRMISSWISGKAYQVRLPFATLDFLSSAIKRLAPFMPSEFCRRPRGLDEIKFWKATEYRTFLLYLGIVVLNDKKKVPLRLYENFLLLHSAVTLLNLPSYSQNLDTIDVMLREFVSGSVCLYGNGFSVFNTHSLLHLTDDCALHGPLDDHSAFPFENYLQILKKRLRSGNQVITQAINRVGDLRQIVNPSSTRSFKFNSSIRDRCFISHDLKVGFIEKVAPVSKDTFLVKMFSCTKDFFKEPICSSDLGIVSVNARDLLDPILVSKDEILSKACALPHNDTFVVIPLNF